MSRESEIAFQKNGNDVLALLELIRKQYEATKVTVPATGATWAEVGSMAHIREQLQEVLLGSRCSADEAEADTLASIEADVATERVSQAKSAHTKAAWDAIPASGRGANQAKS